ncbi:4-hydroxy-2-oxoheptanedioate aldolase [Rhabdobacter roseus]|uniref:4-hydroxy-2-oxoheptanedioate aldolase n=1 Tax=Rhabdobacter roseus TaxID=1655419 RepID=A0A840TY96_9BACT|nr:aldolase/citrate lyase family protein [Rhabdobacter roseus]MBB5284619.1 4-hydroxy-2-oxoheptanedioate aldolase [Rhabdobacter roseus]
MNMRESRVLTKWRAGQTASCFKINLADARSVEIAALAGFDCVWVDQEHIGQDWSILASSVWATKAHNTDLMVRVPRGAYSDYVKPLELDATGLLVPHVMSLAEARKIVEMTRFHPLGKRPIDGGNADGAYTALDFSDYLRQANERRFVMLQIEDKEPLAELEAIAALDGYDALFFGPGDFSQSIGAPGEWNHPELIAARKRVAAVAARFGKFAATVGGPGNLDELRAMGYQFVSLGADVVGLKNYCQELAGAFHKSTQSTSSTSYLES